MEWRVRIDGEEQVAENIEVLRDWFHFGKLRGDDIVYHPILEKWVYARTLSELEALTAPVVHRVNKSGAWCPHCQSRNSYKTTDGIGCVFITIVLISCGLGLIMIPFLPRTWHCTVCGNQWRA